MTTRRSPTSRSYGWVLPLALMTTLAVALVARSATPDAAAALAQRNFPGGPYFTVVCGFSHRNNDDPIRFPRQPGRSHNHTYIGNRNVTAVTTAATLRGGETTCDVEADASTYWVPTVYAAGEPVPPLAGLVYYTKHVSGALVAPPPGLKLVAGNPAAKRGQSKEVVSWSCGGIDGSPRFAALPSCGPDDALELEVKFQNCWNGRHVDSGNHKRHVAYSQAGRCPATHPVRLPTITLVLLYPPVRGGLLSAGRWATHADFINGWDQQALERLTAGLNADRR